MKRFLAAFAAITFTASAATAADFDPTARGLALKALAGGFQVTNAFSELAGNLAAQANARANLGIGSIATQGANAIAVTGGSLNGVTIGATTAAASVRSQLYSGQINYTYGSSEPLTTSNTPMVLKSVLKGTPVVTQGSGFFMSPYQITVNEALTIPYAKGSGVNTLQITDSVGAGASGSRQALYARVLQTAAPLSASDYVSLVGAQLQTTASYSYGGTGGALNPSNFGSNYAGGAFGSNPQVSLLANSNPVGTPTSSGGTGADYYQGVTGEEIDVAVQAGVGAPAQKHGLRISLPINDGVRGAYEDSAQIFGADSGGTGTWLQGIAFGSYGARWAFDVDSTLITAVQRQAGCNGACPTPVALWGMDFTPVQFQAGGGFLRSAGFTVGPAGDTTAATVIVPKRASAPSTAPGAGNVQLFALAGTNAGSCKVQVISGTSTTPVTVADNIGAGC